MRSQQAGIWCASTKAAVQLPPTQPSAYPASSRAKIFGRKQAIPVQV